MGEQLRSKGNGASVNVVAIFRFQPPNQEATCLIAVKDLGRQVFAFNKSHRTLREPPRKARAEGIDLSARAVITIADKVNRAEPGKQNERRSHTAPQDGIQPPVMDPRPRVL